MLSEPKAVLVTGATGFVGSHLVQRLTNEGYQTHILLRTKSDPWRIADILPKLKAHNVDLTDREGLVKLMEEVRPNFIFHLATAGVYGGKSLPDQDLLKINLGGFLNLVEATNDLEYSLFVNTGSSSEYGPKNEAMKEGDVCQPSNMYGITKLAATLYGQAVAATHKKPIVTLRLFSPFGSHDDAKRFMAIAVSGGIKNEELILSNPTAVRDFIYIDDVIDAYLQCMSKAEALRGQVLNIGSGIEIGIPSLCEKLKEIGKFTNTIRKEPGQPRLGESPSWQADITKAKKLLGWQPKRSLEEGLEKTITWFRENLKSYE
ncbi:MAG: NAD-dependent epimerase/dehydratase family protein [bacterium]|nr:NAD-dependent epimerase/dehydratase family protein [bacterium]